MAVDYPLWREWWQAFADEAQLGTVHLGRYQAEYFAWGSGPPLVCIHGLADSFLAFFALAASLRHNFRIIAYNLPDGFRDQARLSQYSLAELTQDVIRVLNHLELDQATLVGHSYGSAVALSAAYGFPRRITRVISICGFAHRPLRSWQTSLLHLGRMLPSHWSCLTPYHADLRRAVSSVVEPASHNNGTLPARDWLATPPPHPLRRWPRVSFRAWVHWALELAKTDLRPILPEITHPTLVIYSQDDPLVPDSCQQELLTQLRHSIGFQVQARGHFPNWTHPHLVAHAISEFHRMTSLSPSSSARSVSQNHHLSGCPLARLSLGR
jgi:pimeloyl-ACP methyl ester carboxylesterase